ncbi:MAG: hypothetical protein U0793_32085 [Gemmataceae bacterium]
MSRKVASSLAILVAFSAVNAAAGQDRDTVFRSGSMEIRQSVVENPGSGGPLTLFTLMRDGIAFGECIAEEKFRRLPTTYYHPKGPAGLAFGRFDWFPAGVNTFHADARLAAALVAEALPLTGPPLAQLWSEPPVAVLGMAAGTPAAYARPLQSFHFYEPSREMIEINDRPAGRRFFHYLADARARGADIRVFEGTPRKQLRERGPKAFYRLMILEACSGEDGERLALDLLTKEGIAECFEHLAPGGVLCVHTSHRFIDLPPILAAIAHDLKLEVRRGHDTPPAVWGGKRPSSVEEGQHFSSEWVLLARDLATLRAICKTPPGYEDAFRKAGLGAPDRYWLIPEPAEQPWTDKGPNLLHGVLRSHPFAMRYEPVARVLTGVAGALARAAGIRSLEFHRGLDSLSRLPPPLNEALVARQLKDSPRVETLWSDAVFWSLAREKAAK